MKAAPVTTGSVRLDKWLWAARCFKTRSKATSACSDGLVTLNGATGKASAKVKVGDRVEVVIPRGRFRILEVKALYDRRGPVELAEQLFDDHSPPPAPRHDPLQDPSVEIERGRGRPTKRDRRRYNDLFGW